MPRSRESDEILQALFSLEEEGKVPARDEAIIERAHVGKAALDEAVESGLSVRSDAGVELSAEGRAAASVLARRHRLAERLLYDVLSVRNSVAESAACEFEHILEAGVTESICTLLGHPRACPHGKPIPAGDCCLAGRQTAAPVVVNLSNMAVGESGTVAYVHTAIAGRLDRLGSFGLVPGTEIRVHQTWPSVVVRLGETELAFDRETARDIYVRKAETPDQEPPAPGRHRWGWRHGRGR